MKNSRYYHHCRDRISIIYLAVIAVLVAIDILAVGHIVFLLVIAWLAHLAS